MSLPTLAEPGATATESATSRAARGPHPAIPAIGSALLLWCAFPTTGWSWLAWFALTPLFLLVTSRRSRAALYFGAWAGGMTFWMLAISWVRLTDDSAWLGWAVMAFVLSLWWPAFLGLGRWAVLRLKLPLMVAAPIAWVALEYVRAYAFTGFPWYYLAHSQHDVLPVIQVADFAGSLGISWLIALVNAWLADVLALPLLRRTPRGTRLTVPQTRRLVVVAGLLAACLGYGAFRLRTAEFRPGPRVALLQSSIPQSIKMRERDSARQIEAIYQRLIARSMTGPAQPDLIVWPETSYPYGGFGTLDATLDAATLDRLIRDIDPEGTGELWRQRIELLSGHLHGWTDKIRTPMLVGTSLYEFRPDGHSRYNAAVLFEPGVATIQSYFKIHLVPFGEYVPLIRYLPWLTALTPYRGTRTPSLDFGRDAKPIDVGRYRIATAICFEDTVPHIVRRFFHETKHGRQPDLLVNISNDGWFHGSAEHDMHLAVSVFRCVENRVPLVRAVNTGISAIVDGNGRVLRALPKLQEGVLADVVPLDDRASLYSAVGDWVGLGCLAVTIGLFPMAWIRRPTPVLAS